MIAHMYPIAIRKGKLPLAQLTRIRLFAGMNALMLFIIALRYKRLITIRTLVRSIAGVNFQMVGKKSPIAKQSAAFVARKRRRRFFRFLLVRGFHVPLPLHGQRKCEAAYLARKRFLAGMQSHVCGQLMIVHECLRAVGALELWRTHMQFLVRFQVIYVPKLLKASITSVRPLASMDSLVGLTGRLQSEALIARVARERLFAGVHAQVLRQSDRLHKRSIAFRTLVRTIVCMHTHVRLIITRRRECFVAKFTLVRLFAVMNAHMLPVIANVIE